MLRDRESEGAEARLVLDKTSVGGVAQIEAAGYAAPYSADSRTLVKIGAVFSSEQKNISEWKVLRR